MLGAGAEGHYPPQGSDHRAVTVPHQGQGMREFSHFWGWERQQEENSELGVPFSGALAVEQGGDTPGRSSRAPQPCLAHGGLEG